MDRQKIHKVLTGCLVSLPALSVCHLGLGLLASDWSESLLPLYCVTLTSMFVCCLHANSKISSCILAMFGKAKSFENTKILP